VLAGAALAVAAYAAAYRWGRLAPWLDGEGRTASGPAGPGALVRPLTLAAPVLGLALLLGLAAQRTTGRFVPGEAFIARELEGRSRVTDFYRALLAHRHRDYRQAQPLFVAALRTMRDSTRRALATTLLGESAYHNGDYATVVAAFEGRARLWEGHAEMLERARGEVGRAVGQSGSRADPRSD
jgi:hypothetical protein